VARIQKTTCRLTDHSSESFDLNTGQRQQAPEEYLRDQIKAAEIGYMSMDILNPPKEAFWGNQIINQPLLFPLMITSWKAFFLISDNIIHG